MSLNPERLPRDALDLSPLEVRARLHQARVSGHPFFPWPQLSPEDWRASLAAIETAVRTVLVGDARPGASASAEPGERVRGSDPGGVAARLTAPAGARALGIAAFTSGTGPLLGFWIERGRLTCDADLASLLGLHLEHGRVRAQRLREELARVVGLLAARGVIPTLIKGFHTAHAYFPDSGARPVSDLDLVIGPADLEAAGAALEDAGFTPKPVLRTPYTCEWTAPGVDPLPRALELTHEGNPWTLDLHASFDRDFGGVHIVSLVPPGVETTEPWDGAGSPVRILTQPYLPAYLAAHASQELKNLTLIRLVELALVLRQGSRDGQLDWDELVGLLERQRAAPFVYPAFELTARLAPGVVPPVVRDFLRAAALPRVRRIVERLAPGSAQRLESVSLDESFMWAVGALDHLRRVRRALLPIWAGPLRERIRVQAARARQLLGGRVALKDDASGNAGA